MTNEEKLAGLRKRASNDLAEAPFSMVKETKRRCGTNMSTQKCAGEAMTRGNKYLDRMGEKDGWLLTQDEWVQERIVVYSEERARKEEASHQDAMERFGEHLLKRFQKELKK